MIHIYSAISFKTSKLVTTSYSTSFSRAVSFLDKEIRDAVYSIYGFVRLADETVDTFHEFNKEKLLLKFERDYYESLEYGLSLNPVLNSFLITVKKYNIPDELVQAFLKSMKLDLNACVYDTKYRTDEYIYGSAEVVGLMCLKVFVRGDENLYRELELPAKKLGSAFQKVNFLRDLRDDTELLKRQYFHHMPGNNFNENIKNEIILDIENDFISSLNGLKKLPSNSRLGVLIAYYFYKKLLEKIRKTPASILLHKRVRVSDSLKIILLFKALIVNKLNLI